MPTIIGRDTKQPDEVLDYDVDFTDWFANREDVYSSFTATADTGITVVSSAKLAGVNKIRVVLSGGANGSQYKVTVLLTTSSGVVKEADFIVKIKAV